MRQRLMEDHAEVTLPSERVRDALRQFEGLYPEKIELSLDRIQDVLETLGRPQDKLPPVIHVAGTNGKGSSCAFLRAMAEAAGLRVHVYSSPHLVRFNERIRLAGQLVEDAPLTGWLNRTYAALKGRHITPFEATTATALLAFSEIPADLLILEVGLGGRFDATNVIDQPALSVITPVDYDHKQFLGTDLAQIAREKAGIIKQGRPVVSAIQSRICGDVISEQADRLGAPLHFLNAQDLQTIAAETALPGGHQRYNAALAALALRVLRHPAIDESAIRSGTKTARWSARMQKLGPGPLSQLAQGTDVWLDGGHNPHAARALAAMLQAEPGSTHLVSAMMESKDHGGYFLPFQGLAEAVHTCPNASGHVGADPVELALKARAFLPYAKAYNSFDAAFRAALSHQPDRILICGSLYLAGDVLLANHEIPD